MKRDMVVLSAIVTNDLKAFWCISYDHRGLFSSTFRASLRRHHIALIESLLLFFREYENLSTLHTRDLNIRHRLSSYQQTVCGINGYAKEFITSAVPLCKASPRQFRDMSDNCFAESFEIVAAFET